MAPQLSRILTVNSCKYTRLNSTDPRSGKAALADHVPITPPVIQSQPPSRENAKQVELLKEAAQWGWSV